MFFVMYGIVENVHGFFVTLTYAPPLYIFELSRKSKNKIKIVKQLLPVFIELFTFNFELIKEIKKVYIPK